MTEAVAEYVQRGFASVDRLNYWMERLRRTANAEGASETRISQLTRSHMEAIIKQEIERGNFARGNVLKRHENPPSAYKLKEVRPALRKELDRRIRASADLIKINKTEMVEKTLQRFSGWATSVPPGGTDLTDRMEVKSNIAKPLSSLPFQERCVLIDQGHKLVSNISEIVAVDNGALCGHWVSHYTQPGYNYRKQHKHYDIDDQYFIVPDNWALQKGLMKKGGYRYVTEIERPGEKIFCRCYYQWIYNLASLPSEMLTAKGREALQEELV